MTTKSAAARRHEDDEPTPAGSQEEYNAAEMAVREVLGAMVVPFTQLGPEEQSEMIRTMVHAAVDAAKNARAGD